MMQASLTKLRAVFEGHSFSRLSPYAGQAASEPYECCQFCVPEVDWMGEWDRTRKVTSNSALVTCKGFGNWASVSFGGKFGSADTVRDEFLMRCDPGAEFSCGLLKMDKDVVVEDVAVFAENLFS